MPPSGPKAPPPPRPPSRSQPSFDSGRIELSDGPIHQTPERPKPQGDASLNEVEHALAALEGRHPEFVRAEREKAEAAAKRRRELEQAEVKARAVSRRRTLVAGVSIVLLAIAGVTARQIFEAKKRVISEADALARSFAPLGFQEVAPDPWANAERLEVAVPAGTCLVALGASNGKPVAIEVGHDGDLLEADGSMGLCTCNNETITVTAKGGEAGKRSVRLLKTDAREFGSVLGFDRAPVHPASVVSCACLEDQVDGWLSQKSATNVLLPPDAEAKQMLGSMPELARAGMTAVASTKKGTTLLPLAVSENSCVLAMAADPAAKISLRAPGGARVVPDDHGGVAVCSKVARTFGAWTATKSPVHVFKVDAARAGGRHELRRIVNNEIGLPPRVWIEPADIPWDAELTLRAIRVAPTYVVDWGTKSKIPQDARLLVFSVEGVSSNDAPATSAGVAVCERSDERAPTLLCVQTSRQPWKDPGEKMRGAVAYGPLPSWLKPLADLQENGAGAAALAMVSLTRRLAARGFEPTPLEAVTDTPNGADVLGRAGEDAIVAVSVLPSPPFVAPLTDGPGWTLDGAPRVIDLPPGKRISLRSKVPLGGDVDQRRTIVYRRSATAPK